MTCLEEITVGTVENVARVRDRLSFEFSFLDQQGVRVSLEESRVGDTTVFSCALMGDSSEPARVADLKMMFRHCLANALSDLIVNEWERALILELLRAQYECFSQTEQWLILSSAARALDSREDGRPDLFRKVERKGKVLRLLLEYLSTHNEINLEGFITFRLRDYREQLSDAVGRAVDEFLMEREYQEFISLLRYFVQSQEPRLQVLHVVIRPRGAFKLMDDRGAAVTDDYLAESFLDTDWEVNSEDLLVSALITIAPERVVLHCPTKLDRTEGLDTIRAVFEGRVTTCRGCQLCREERRPTTASNVTTHRGAARGTSRRPLR